MPKKPSMTILFVQTVYTTLATPTVVNSRRWQLVTLALFTCKFWTKLFQFKANDARFQLIQNLNPNLVLWVKNTAFASNQLAMSKVFVKATFVSGTFDGKSLSLELPLPPFLLFCWCHAVSFDFCTAVRSFTQFLSWPKHYYDLIHAVSDYKKRWSEVECWSFLKNTNFQTLTVS